ncbi:hypothetical protein ZEAMMB73_Zm00001d035559 [Zea mays]|jgi:hypothetical protein|uniref:Uncharacterized protein n=1 Tax=Zea mays TaxID=4577 RepID=A0A1D6LH73_MAIZE|nr:hypothetical protein ZEAMMB73_Zm00001d035559 [Zea mays]
MDPMNGQSTAGPESLLWREVSSKEGTLPIGTAPGTLTSSACRFSARCLAHHSNQTSRHVLYCIYVRERETDSRILISSIISCMYVGLHHLCHQDWVMGWRRRVGAGHHDDGATAAPAQPHRSCQCRRRLHRVHVY